MTTRFSDKYNVVNLARNGGLDYDAKDPMMAPPFWKVEGADPGSPGTTGNAFSVGSETPENEIAAPRFFRLFLTSMTPVGLIQNLTDRFIQSGFVSMMCLPQMSVDSRAPAGYSIISESQLVRGKPVTLAASIRVLKGSVKVEYGIAVKGGISYLGSQVIYPALEPKTWVRPAWAFDLTGHMMKQFRVRFTNVKNFDVSEVQVGAFSLVQGGWDEVPYTGDPSADAIPKGTVVMAFGSVCPPGFAKMSFDAPRKAGRVFFKSGAPSLTVEGEEKHDHAAMEATMNPDEKWPRTFLVPNDNSATRGDDAIEAHSHKMEPDYHVPPTKDVILCKRL